MRVTPKNLAQSSTLAILLVLIPACDMPGKLNNMNGSTASMDSTTKELLKTTDQMKGSTDHLTRKMDAQLTKTDGVINQTSELLDLERQGGAVEIRRNALSAMVNAHSAGDKLAQASIYFQSFEFQTFTGSGEDLSLEKRDVLFADAFNEFFMKLNEYSAKVDNVSPFAMKIIEESPSFLPYSQTNQQACFDALAATLHMVNRKQTENVGNLKASGKLDLDVVSMYSLIANAMAKEKQINTGKISISSLSKWEQIVLSNRESALRLLQARHNMILGIALGQMVPETRGRDKFFEAAIAVNDLMPRMTKLGAAINDFEMSGVRMLMKKLYSWNLDLDKYNLAQLQTFQEYLQAVVDTREVLKTQLGVPVQVNKFLQEYMDTAIAKSEVHHDSTLAAAQTSFLGTFSKVKANQ